MGSAFLSPLLVGSSADSFEGVIHGVLRMHGYTCGSAFLTNDMDIANQDIVNAYGGGYNAWDVPAVDFIKFQKVGMTSLLHHFSTLTSKSTTGLVRNNTDICPDGFRHQARPPSSHGEGFCSPSPEGYSHIHQHRHHAVLLRPGTVHQDIFLRTYLGILAWHCQRGQVSRPAEGHYCGLGHQHRRRLVDSIVACPNDLVSSDDKSQEIASRRDSRCWGTCYGVQHMAIGDHGGGEQHDKHDLVLDSLCPDCVRT